MIAKIIGKRSVRSVDDVDLLIICEDNGNPLLVIERLNSGNTVVSMPGDTRFYEIISKYVVGSNNIVYNSAGDDWRNI